MRKASDKKKIMSAIPEKVSQTLNPHTTTTIVNEEHGELRETYRTSPAIIHLFISLFKVNFLIVSFCVNICNKNNLFDSYFT